MGLAHYNTSGFSDSSLLGALGIGVEYQWASKVGFRFDLRTLELSDLAASGSTTNVELLWGPSFSF